MAEHPISLADTLSSNAEKHAREAEELSAFSGFKLVHVKRTLTTLLAQIGREGIFDQYTRHDISHINQMLAMLDWMIPVQTVQVMSKADWLMTVLAVYFHDLGMLVTREEFERRYESGFGGFKESVLFSGDSGKDYQEKVARLEADKAERFLYQEFVRHTHAKRIRSWIMGQVPQHLGVAHAVVNELDDLLRKLPPLFRRDLGLVCESHHLDDLADLSKYKASQPYGTSRDETVNLQYAAVLTRTTDLLHITSDRTPSVEFRLINPSDPISQEEWSKQRAVNNIRSQLGRDKDGNLSEEAHQDTIEVHAFFTQPSGFFGLTSYLSYAKQQLQKSHEWVRRAKEIEASKHSFPWRHIDDSRIETEGFLPKPFEFQLDQAKVLDLLTGHTLYNDTTVVVRELVQNAIDAIRLQRLIDQRKGESETVGRIEIRYETATRTLFICDNGTGMTQEIIEKHLLRAGSSRYQEADIKRQYPSFSPISRFGIGILSSFMVADAVELFTCTPDEQQARQLSLRSVHGKYLIRLLDKHSPEIREINPHGTVVKLKLRASADLEKIVDIARHWIVVPSCPVSIRIDGNNPIEIGFKSPKKALESTLESLGYAVVQGAGAPIDGSVRVEETTINGLTLAYATRWSESFREWFFLEAPTSYEDERFDLGTCVEGIRVTNSAPGYSTQPIFAIANATGPNAPKTNVARSGFEATHELGRVLSSIYRIYCEHVGKECAELHSSRSFSLAWATQEANYLLSPLTGELRYANDEELLLAEIRNLSALLLEKSGERRVLNANDLSLEPFFWTVDSAFFRSAEHLIRESTGNASLHSLVKTLEGSSKTDIPEPLLCAFSPWSEMGRAAVTSREVDSIVVNKLQRRIDLRWAPKSTPSRWLSLPLELIPNSFARYKSRGRGGRSFRALLGIQVANTAVPTQGLGEELGIRSYGVTYIRYGTPLAAHLAKVINLAIQTPSDISIGSALLTLEVVKNLLRAKPKDSVSKEQLRRMLGGVAYFGLPEAEVEDCMNMSALLDIVNTANWRVFDTLQWLRAENLGPLDDD